MVVSSVVCFCFKDTLFSIVLAPKSPQFVTYRLIEKLTGLRQTFDVGLVSVDLAQQFLVHMKVALMAGFVIVMPYIIFVLFRFVSPGLYDHERHNTAWAATGGYVMFVLGLLLSYFVIFPLTFRFLGTYQVDATVENHITLTSYISVFVLLGVAMGLMFEMPVVGWLLARVGVLHSSAMSRVRRYAVVVILVLAAIITPTGDPFTLMVVALPLYLLYEFSIVIVKKTEKK